MCVQVPVICCVPAMPHHQGAKKGHLGSRVAPSSSTYSLKVLDDVGKPVKIPVGLTLRMFF